MSSFFKIMIGNFSEQLRVPPAYRKHLHFDHLLHPKVILKNRVGIKSNVYVKKVGKNLFFDKGWKLFVAQNPIEWGDFLVFEYVGDSELEVRIFGKNGCEKEVESVDSRNKGKEMSSHDNESENEELTPTQGKLKESTQKMSDTGAERPSCSWVRTGIQEKITKANETVNTFTSKHPYFRVVISKSYLHRENVCIPKRSLMEHIQKGIHNVTLWSPPQSSWDVKLHLNERGRFGAGWLAFVKHNNLQEGDVCFFELITTNNVVLKVSIIR